MEKQERQRHSSVLKMSFEERVNMYMGHDKEELARMLAMRDTLNDMGFSDKDINIQNYIDSTMKRCDSLDDCTNPCRDCVDCPVGSGNYSWYNNVYKPSFAYDDSARYVMTTSTSIGDVEYVVDGKGNAVINKI